MRKSMMFIGLRGYLMREESEEYIFLLTASTNFLPLNQKFLLLYQKEIVYRDFGNEKNTLATRTRSVL